MSDTSVIEIIADTSVVEIQAGPIGPSAFQVAVANGFAGSVGEWLLSLHGKDGLASLSPYGQGLATADGASAARLLLELGASATRPVGTTAGDVASGDAPAAAIATVRGGVGSAGDTLAKLLAIISALGTGDIAGLATALAGKQALDATLTALAGQATQAYGRGLLNTASAAALTAGLGAATTTVAGILSATDKAKLDGVAAGATANATDAALRDRATHTGAQAQSTVTGLVTDLAAKAPLASPALTGAPSAPTAAAGTNSTQIASTAFVQAAITALLGGATPAALDTLYELAAALGNDANFATTVTTALAGKQPIDATLTALAGLAGGAGKLPYFTGVDVLAQADLTAFARTFLDDADGPTVLATIGAQPLAAALTALAALTTAANKGLYFTAPNTPATFDLTAAGRALIDDADASAQRLTLGLSALAVLGVGTGLASSGGNLVPDFGTTSGKVAQGDDSRITGAAQKSAANTFADAQTIAKAVAGGVANLLRLGNTGTGNGSAVLLSLDPAGLGFNVRDAQIVATTNGGNQITVSFRTADANLPVEYLGVTPGGIANFPIGLKKAGVNVATTADVQDAVNSGAVNKYNADFATTAQTTLSGSQVVDGVTPANGSIIFVRKQTALAEQGLYVFNTGGAWPRSTLMDTWAKALSSFVFVSGGSTLAKTGWSANVASGGTLGTTALTFTQSSAAGSYTGSGGIALTGSDFALTAGGTTNAKLADMAAGTLKGALTAGAPVDMTFAQVKTGLALVKGDVGLGNVDNTSDASKPVSTAQQTALDAKVGKAGIYYAVDYGVSPSNSAATNATAMAALATAVNGSTATSVQVVFPPGRIDTSGGMQFTRGAVSLDLRGCTLRKTAACTLLTYYSPGGAIENFEIWGGVLSADTTAAPVASNQNGVATLNVRGIHFHGTLIENQQKTISFALTVDMRLQGVTVQNFISGIDISAGSIDFFAINTYVRQTGVSSPVAGTKALILTGIGGCYISQSGFLLCDYGIYANPGDGAQVAFVFVGTGSCLDTCGDGLWAKPQAGTSGYIDGLQISNAWFSSCTRYGGYFENCKTVLINNTRVLYNAYDGLRFKNGNRVSVNGGYVQCNNVSNDAHGLQGAGIRFEDVPRTIVTSTFIDNLDGLVNNQKIGIKSNSGCTSRQYGFNIYGGHSVGDEVS